MIMAYRYLEANLSPSSSADHTPIAFHPFIDSLSHHATNADLFRKITLSPISSSTAHPFSTPQFSQILLAEGDFTTIFPHSKPHAKTYDIIVTHYFIDTARNLMSYLETIYALLSPGGAWINFGPLLYGTGPWVQLSLDEIVLVSEELGFDFDDLPGAAALSSSTGEERGTEVEGTNVDQHICGKLTFPGAAEGSGMSKVRGRFSSYGFDERALTRNAYRAQSWVARKRRST